MGEFEGFYLLTKDEVFRVVLAAGGSRVAAEDAVAEAYARAYGRWEKVREHPHPRAWVLKTALNFQRSWWRRTRREVLGDPPEVAHVSNADDSGLRKLVEALPRRQREAVALRLLADLSASQTAEILGIAEGTVHVHLHRALAALRGSISEFPAPGANSSWEVTA
jgi:RNA polymerase sigma factor (sigma-70 family)